MNVNFTVGNEEQGLTGGKKEEEENIIAIEGNKWHTQE